MGTLCNDQAYTGRLVTNDRVDDDFKTAEIVMGPARCQDGQIDIPLAVDDDRSRIWQIRRTDNGVRLKHDHSHADGTKDQITQYGGDSFGDGSVRRQVFPVDAETEQIFDAGNIPVSKQNNWAVEIEPGQQFAYEMWRPNRHFRLEFDLAAPVAAPPPPWAIAPLSK